MATTTNTRQDTQTHSQTPLQGALHSQDQTRVSLPKQIIAPRLNLRAIEMRDAENLSRAGSDYDIARMMLSLPYPLPVIAAEGWIMIERAATQLERSVSYVIEDSQSGAFYGIINLKISGQGGVPELGYWFAKSAWGLGYATEACRALLMTYEKLNGPTEFQSGHILDNPNSGRVLRKLGFEVQNGTISQFSLGRGERIISQRYIRPKSQPNADMNVVKSQSETLPDKTIGA